MSWAAQKGYLKVVELLLQHGATPTAVTVGGRTALEVATSEGHDDVVRVLKAAGA
eukprot:Skav223949  [mRNA]  locus=scaffold798:107168:107332:- [translate_table: standard]